MNLIFILFYHGINSKFSDLFHSAIEKKIFEGSICESAKKEGCKCQWMKEIQGCHGNIIHTVSHPAPLHRFPLRHPHVSNRFTHLAGTCHTLEQHLHHKVKAKPRSLLSWGQSVLCHCLLQQLWEHYLCRLVLGKSGHWTHSSTEN